MDDDAPDVLNKNSVMRIRTSAHKFSTGTNNPVKTLTQGTDCVLKPMKTMNPKTEQCT